MFAEPALFLANHASPTSLLAAKHKIRSSSLLPTGPPSYGTEDELLAQRLPGDMDRVEESLSLVRAVFEEGRNWGDADGEVTQGRLAVYQRP